MVVSILSNELILKCSPPVRQFTCVLTWPVVRVRHAPMVQNAHFFAGRQRVKQQLKRCDILQLPSDAIDWSTIYESNCYDTNETKLRSF